MKSFKLLTSAIAALLTSASGLSAQVLFSENFDTDHTANWAVNLSHANAFGNVFFDYSTLGIPSAPGAGGTTRGLRFIVNQSAGVQQGISASPLGQSFTGDYRMSFNAWMNYTQPESVGGSGTTQVSSYGIGTSGTAAQWAGSSASIMLGQTPEGGSTVDYRIYTNNTLLAPASGVYAAGTGAAARNNTDPYYTTAFPGGATIPAAQVTLFPSQDSGGDTTIPGNLGFKWIGVEIDKIGNTVTWKIDGVLLGTLGDISTANKGGNNIFLGQFDINNGSSTDPDDQLITTIYDNLVIQALPVPEPTTVTLFAAGGMLLGYRWLRNRRK